MKEIRWHARAGQGAKTASQLFATASLRSGQSVQAFPEYGPERRGAPLRAYTRVSDRPIRRHDSVTTPDVVVVLEPSLLGEVDVAEGLSPKGFVLLNADAVPAARHHTVRLRARVTPRRGPRNEVRQRRHGRRTRGRARRAAPGNRRRRRRRAARQEGRRRGGPRRPCWRATDA